MVLNFDSLETRQCLSTYHITDSAPASVVFQGAVGQSISFQYSFSTDDSNETTENEPLVIHSGDNAFADVTVQPTYGTTSSLQTLTFTALSAKETITASIEGGDDDEKATLVTAGEVDPKKVEPRANGDIVVSYAVVSQLPSGTSQTIGVFWASGPNGTDVLPNGNQKPLFSYSVDAAKTPGTYQFTVPASSLTTAPNGTTHLLLVADPPSNLGSHSAEHAILADAAKVTALSASQLEKVLPGLSTASATTLAAPLNDAMAAYGITSLEQRAMFLAQIGHESANLTTWDEAGGNAYYVSKYWVDKSKWSGLGQSTPTKTGLTLSVPAPTSGTPPATKDYQLYWAKGPKLANGSSLISTATFTLKGKAYTSAFGGGVPPALTTYLLVVDPKTRHVLLAIHQKLGNWSPQDAIDFHGRGPIQLTGRYNFQVFANNVHQQDIMTNPSQISDSSHPLLGLKSAAWFWEVEFGHKLNEVVNKDAGSSSSKFNKDVTRVINSGLKGLQDRLNRYLRIRNQLLDPAF